MTNVIILTDKQSHKSGMLNAAGEIVLPFKYDALVRSRNSQIIFVKGETSGFMDHNGKVLFTTNFKGLSPFYEGYAAAAQYDGRPGFPCATVTSQIGKPSYATLYTFIDSTGKPFPGGYYEMVSAFRDGCAMVVTNCVPYLIDKQGKPVMYGKHYLFSHFRHDVAVIADKKFKKFGLVHKSGKILAEPIYDEIKTESEYPYPNNITFGVNAYGTNLKAFTFPKIEKGAVTAIIKDRKNYSEQVTKVPVN